MATGGNARKFYDEYHRKSHREGDEVVTTRESLAFGRQALGLLEPREGDRFLDLSCGQGLYLKLFHHLRPGLQYHGLDLSRVAVDAARRRVPQARLRVGDAMATGYPSRHFDRITCLGSLEHYPDPARGLKEIHRLLKDGGRALVYVPNLFFLGYMYLVLRTGETPHEAEQNQYERLETRQGWEDLIHGAGFRVLAVRKHNDMTYTRRIPDWTKPLYRLLVQPFIPLNWSYCFSFLLEKETGSRARSGGGRP